MDVSRYLERIGFDGPVSVDLDTLQGLHRAHLRNVPYENLDVQLGRPVTTAIGPIYRKIVEGRRGGWCYEMNGIFGWALERLGFGVRRGAGAVMREVFGETTIGNHLVLPVELPQGTYLADVGFGDGPIEPVALREGAFTSGHFQFRLSRPDDKWWRLHNHPKGGAPSFDFTLDRADESLLAERCEFLQSSAQSTFVQNLVCQRHSTSGLTILRGRVLRHIEGMHVCERLLESANELVAVLQDEFGLEVPEVAGLWPKIAARHAELFQAGDQLSERR